MDPLIKSSVHGRSEEVRGSSEAIANTKVIQDHMRSATSDGVCGNLSQADAIGTLLAHWRMTTIVDTDIESARVGRLAPFLRRRSTGSRSPTFVGGVAGLQLNVSKDGVHIMAALLSPAGLDRRMAMTLGRLSDGRSGGRAKTSQCRASQRRERRRSESKSARRTRDRKRSRLMRRSRTI